MNIPINILLDYCDQEVKEGREANFVKNLAYIIENTHQIPEPDQILGYIGSSAPPKTPRRTQYEHSNLKFKSLYVRCIRKYPDNGKFYRLDFTSDNGIPISCVYIGRNGVGKTTLFHALEMTMLGRLESIDKVEMEKDERTDYMKNLFSPHPENGMAVIETVSSFQKEKQLLYRVSGDSSEYRFPPACLCSGRDIETLIQGGIKKEFIAEQLNLENLRILVENLREAHEKYKEDNRDLEEAKLLLLKLESDSTQQVSLDIQIKECQTNIDKLKEMNNALTKSESDISEFVNCKEYLENRYKEFLEKLATRATDILNKLVSDFMGDDIKEAEIIYDGYLSLSIIITPRNPYSTDSTSILKVSPAFYLNNFRQKLFYVAFKAALFLFAREYYGNNYPFIIDDIFDSSDFENRDKVMSFMNKLHCLGDNEKDKNLTTGSLQVILFTQDDVIAEEAYRGMRQSGVPAKFARIFEWDQIEDGDKERPGYYRDFQVIDDTRNVDNLDKFQSIRIEDVL